MHLQPFQDDFGTDMIEWSSNPHPVYVLGIRNTCSVRSLFGDFVLVIVSVHEKEETGCLCEEIERY